MLCDIVDDQTVGWKRDASERRSRDRTEGNCQWMVDLQRSHSRALFLSLSLSLSLPLVVVHAVLHLPKVWMVQPMSNVLLLARKEVIGDNNLMSLHHEFVHQV